MYSWIYTLAQANKDLVFEYVKSTERGKYTVNTKTQNISNTKIKHVKQYFADHLALDGKRNH